LLRNSESTKLQVTDDEGKSLFSGDPLFAKPGQLPDNTGLGDSVLCGRRADEHPGSLPANMFQAAIFQLAPPSMILPCGSVHCCWRWAAHRLLEEYDSKRRIVEGLRHTLDEELGRSVRNRLMELEVKHEEVLCRYREAVEEAKSYAKRQGSFERELRDSQEARANAEHRFFEAERLHRQEAWRAEAKIDELRDELRRAFERPGAAELEEKLKVEKDKIFQLQSSLEQTQDELNNLRVQRTELEWQLGQAKAAVAKKAKPNRTRQRSKMTDGQSMAVKA